MIYSFIATCNKADVNPREWMEDVMPQMKVIAPNDFASLEKLLPGEWKKSHPESHSMVHHTTEAEHMAAILKSREKRKALSVESPPLKSTQLLKVAGLYEDAYCVIKDSNDLRKNIKFALIDSQ